MNGFCVIGPNVNVYNVNTITLDEGAEVSQGVHLCTASHDISDPAFKLITAPIRICEKCWVAADAFIGMGVTLHEGSVIGARSVVVKDVEAWTVVGGNPAKKLKERIHF